MAAYIFLRWVLVLTNPSFLWNNAAPNVKKIPLLIISQCCLLPCICVYILVQDARRFNYWSLYLDCTALTRKRNARFVRLASCKHGRLWEYWDGNGNSLTLGAALFHENDRFVKNYDNQNPPQKNVCCHGMWICWNYWLLAGKIWVMKLWKFSALEMDPDIQDVTVV